MRQNLILLFLITVSSVAFAQSKAELKQIALRDAQAACDATLKKDFKSLLKYTHPNILDAVGGAEVMASYLATTFKSMEDEGFKYLKAETQSVSDIVKEQGEFRCYVENYNEMLMNDKKIISTSYMLGTYNQNDKHWYFVEAKEMRNKGAVSSLFPDFKTELDIPENKMKFVDL